MSRKYFIIASVICSIFIVIFLILLKDTEKNVGDIDNKSDLLVSAEQALDDFEESIGEYSNLIIHDFETSFDDIESIHNIKILSNREHMERTLLEEFSIMNDVIDSFFMESFDKSFLSMFFLVAEDIEPIAYGDIEEKCADGRYDSIENAVLSGNNTRDGGYKIQIARGKNLVWFSKNGFGTTLPSSNTPKYVYSYLNGIRQSENVEIRFKDRVSKLSEFESSVISYMNNSFPLDVSEGVMLGIGEIQVIDVGDYEGVCVRARRIYKGIPFEYFSTSSAEGQYVDKYECDGGELAYIESMSPDTLVGFGHLKGRVVEIDTVNKILPIDKALNILSYKIGNNSIYDVYGIELVYRECYTREEIDSIRQNQNEDIASILKPVWKIISINQNDDKYTLFYIDVVTGEITERFEYNYVY